MRTFSAPFCHFFLLLISGSAGPADGLERSESWSTRAERNNHLDMAMDGCLLCAHVSQSDGRTAYGESRDAQRPEARFAGSRTATTGATLVGK